MFHAKPRPVPSKAALRVLYQLAYISSGTAVGAGVLCAEERRRRTQIVQRIADNAKRIRQHPRYAANAAAQAAVRDEEFCEDWPERRAEEHDGKEKEERVRQKEGGQRRAPGYGWRSAEQGVKGRDLPSVVDEEYHLLGGKKKRKRGIEPKTADPLAVGLGKSHAAPAAESSARTVQQRGCASSLLRPPGNDSLNSTYRPSHSSSGRINLRTAPKTQAVGRLDQSSSIEQICRGLLKTGRTSEAVECYVKHMHRSCSKACAGSLVDSLFDAALKAELFSECADLLRLQREHGDHYTSQCEALIRACAIRNSFKVLLDIFFREVRPLPVDLPSLSPQTRATLAIACSEDDALYSAFEQIYRSLDREWRATVSEKRCHMLLRVTWQSTGNLDAVHAQLQPMRKHLEQVNDRGGLWKVYKAMVYIYVAANRTTEALETISRMYKAGNKKYGISLSISLVAYQHAKRGAWDSVHQVLQTAASQRLNSRTTLAMDTIVSLYSRGHSAASTWKFVTYLWDNFHYRPRHFASRDILAAFVTNQAISLVPKWLHMLKVSGEKLKIDDKFAAYLLLRYYERYRPSHVLIMWFCRNLAHLVPSFDPERFMELIRKSIDYDLSGVFERNAPWQQEHAQRRLQRLNKSEGEVPSPGFKCSRQLFFRHPDAKAAPASTGKDDERVPKSPRNTADHEPVERSVSVDQQALTDVNEKTFETHITPNMHKKTSEHDSLESRMRTQLASNRYDAVLRLYEQCLDGVNVPWSQAALTLAVRASLKLHGDESHALQIIAHAERTGMNVVAALAPILIHRMQNFDLANRDNARTLRDLTMRYYRVSKEHSYAATHHLAVTAAHLLILRGRPGLGIEILRAVLSSSWTAERPADIVFMTVLVKGYFVRGYTPDVLFWIREVLTTDLRISPGLIRELRRGLKGMPSAARRERAQVRAMIEACLVRRQEQAFEAKILGKKLVQTIVRCMRDETTVDIDARTEMDEELFGEHQNPNRRKTAEESKAPQELDNDSTPKKLEPEPAGATLQQQQPRLTRRERRLRKLREAIRHESAVTTDSPDNEISSRHQRSKETRWQRQYRAFLRKPMVLEDGRYASYRYYVASESPAFSAKEQARQARLRERRERFWEVGGEEARLGQGGGE